MEKYDVLTSGYVSLDHMLKVESPVSVGFTSLIRNKSNVCACYGGCSVNIALALCRLGTRSMPIIRVGEDYESSGFRSFLQGNHIPTEGVTKVPEEITSVCYLIQSPEGEHITLFYPGAMDGRYAAPMPDGFFENAAFGVITVGDVRDNREFFAKCKKHGVPVVFGMKLDFNAFPRPFLQELITGSRMIFMNEKEHEMLKSMLHIDHIQQLFSMGECRVVVVTRGKKGSRFYHLRKDGEVECGEVPICDCWKVEDATGSGDSYLAGFLYGYLEKYSMLECCAMGSTLSSFVVEKEGCCTNLPERDVLLKRYDEFVRHLKRKGRD